MAGLLIKRIVVVSSASSVASAADAPKDWAAVSIASVERKPRRDWISAIANLPVLVLQLAFDETRGDARLAASAFPSRPLPSDASGPPHRRPQSRRGGGQHACSLGAFNSQTNLPSNSPNSH